MKILVSRLRGLCERVKYQSPNDLIAWSYDALLRPEDARDEFDHQAIESVNESKLGADFMRVRGVSLASSRKAVRVPGFGLCSGSLAMTETRAARHDSTVTNCVAESLLYLFFDLLVITNVLQAAMAIDVPGRFFWKTGSCLLRSK